MSKTTDCVCAVAAFDATRTFRLVCLADNLDLNLIENAKGFVDCPESLFSNLSGVAAV